jgi:trimeric autotransporter adhesin
MLRNLALLSFCLVPGLVGQTRPPEISVPRLIRFSASLPEAGQNGVSGVLFSLYRDQFDGAPLWTEVQNVQTDKLGGYSVLLGSTRNEGFPADLFSGNEPRWLEVEMNGVKQPRVLIGSVPYALVAGDAQTLGGLPPSAYLRVAASTVSNSTVVANVSAPVVGVRADATSGTPGYLGVFTNGTDLGNSALYQNGNTISIGGTASLGAVTLIGSVPSGDTPGMALYNSGGGGGASVSLDMYNTYANAGIPQAKIKALDDGNYSDHITFWTKNSGAATNPVAERVRFASNGNVGIGTTTPGAKLEVAGTLKISGTGSGIAFPDGTTQTTAVQASSITSNIAIGPSSLQSNTGGTGNSAYGYQSLQSNTTGSQNTAHGTDALRGMTTGVYNTALGYSAMVNSIGGSYNSAVGSYALQNDAFGDFNTAVGSNSLAYNNTGNDNTAVGEGALYAANSSGNIGIGSGAGFNITSGSENIMIGNQGTSADTYTTRIDLYQTQTFIAGISGINVSGVPVVVSSTGQLGVAQSSRRFKEDIQDMGDASNSLMRLRPVTYRYEQAYPDGSKPLDFGLIAEEVADVFPDLVARSKDGQIETVMYQKLTPMLLNEVQKLNAELTEERERIKQLETLVHQLLARPTK